MRAKRTFNAVFVAHGHGVTGAATATADQVVMYDGTAATAP
jgi:hypothetical protein